MRAAPGRQRSWSEASDRTVVPKTFRKSASAKPAGAVVANDEVQSCRNAEEATFKSSLEADGLRARSVKPDPLVETKLGPQNQDEEREDRPPSTTQRQTATFTNGSRVVEQSSILQERSLSPRTLQILVVSLQLLSLIPAVIGVAFCLWRTLFPISTSKASRDIGRRIEWLLSAVWAGLSGWYCHSMARGLTRRWLVYYPLPAAMIRLVSVLQPEDVFGKDHGGQAGC